MSIRQLLRSSLRGESENDEDEDVLAAHLLALDSVQLEGIHLDIAKFATELHARSHFVPSLPVLLDHYDKLMATGDGRGYVGHGEVEAIAAEVPLVGAEFEYALRGYVEKLNNDTLTNLTVQLAAVLRTGVEVERVIDGKRANVTLQGSSDALALIQETLANVKEYGGASTHGEFRKDAPKSITDYEYAKAHPELTTGMLTGIKSVDALHRGAKPGELVLVLGFTSHMKTSLVVNWAYRSAVWYGRNVAFASLEMPSVGLRDLFLVMHATHARFNHVSGLTRLDYEKLRSGNLTDDEEKLLREVADDFENNPAYGRLFYIEPEHEMTVGELRQWVEKLHVLTPIDLVVIDYLGLCGTGKGTGSQDKNQKLNRVVLQAKEFARTFNKGKGVALVSPWQASREGFKEAEKNGGRYKLTAMADANEAERSADVVYFTYTDEMKRTARRMSFGNLKNRNGKKFDDVLELHSDPPTRLIEDVDLNNPRQAPVAGGMDIDMATD